jgi:hypothetical protein
MMLGTAASLIVVITKPDGSSAWLHESCTDRNVT